MMQLPSLIKKRQSSHFSDDDFDYDNDPFRQSTATFVSAREEPSYEDLKSQYHPRNSSNTSSSHVEPLETQADAGLTKNLEKLYKANNNNSNPALSTKNPQVSPNNIPTSLAKPASQFRESFVKSDFEKEISRGSRSPTPDLNEYAGTNSAQSPSHPASPKTTTSLNHQPAGQNIDEPADTTVQSLNIPKRTNCTFDEPPREHKREFSISSYIDGYYDDYNDTVNDDVTPPLQTTNTSTNEKAIDAQSSSADILEVKDSQAKEDVNEQAHANQSMRNVSTGTVRSIETIGTVTKHDISGQAIKKPSSVTDDKPQPQEPVLSNISEDTWIGTDISVENITGPLNVPSEQDEEQLAKTYPNQTVFEPHNISTRESNRLSELPLPSNRFNAPGARISVSDSMRSFGGDETDDTASLNTGRKSPQSFINSNRESYDQKAYSFEDSSSLGPKPSNLQQNFENTLSDDSSSVSSPATRSGFWKPIQSDFTEFGNSSVTTTGAIAGTPRHNSATPEKGDTQLDGDILNEDKTNINSTSSLNSDPNDDRYSFESDTKKTKGPTKDRYSFDTEPNEVKSTDDGKISVETSQPRQVTLEDISDKDSQPDTPVTNHQKALERDIMISLNSPKAASTEFGNINDPFQRSIHSLADSQRTVSNSKSTSSLARPTTPFSNLDAPKSLEQPSPSSPAEPDPEIAALYTSQSQLLTRPLSQLIDSEHIAQTQPLSPTRTKSPVAGSSAGDKSLSPLLEDKATEPESYYSNKASGFGNSDSGDSDKSVNNQRIDGSRQSKDIVPSSPSFSTASDIDALSENSKANKSHSRNNSVDVKSLLLDLSPQTSTISARLNDYRSYNEASDTLSPLKESLASRLNKPPTLDFRTVLTKPRSEDRREAFDSARLAQANYDSGLHVWLSQVSQGHNMRDLNKATSQVPSQPVKTGILRTSRAVPSRKLSSTLNEVSSMTQELANKLHVGKVAGKSTNAAKGFFNRGRKMWKSKDSS